MGFTSAGAESLDGTGIASTPLPGEPQQGNPPVNWVATDRQGIRYWPSGNREDPNGNEITAGTSGWVDTLGRIIPYIPSPVAAADATGCTGTAATVDVALWNLPGYNGGTRPIKLCYADFSVSTNFPSGRYPTNQVVGSYRELQSVVLYNGSDWTTSPAWTFEYNDDYGDLTSLTTPTGGSITYTWGSINTQSNCNTAIASYRRGLGTRTVAPGDGQPSGTWTYTLTSQPAAAASYTNTVADPSGNQTVYTFFALQPGCDEDQYETLRQYYAGSASSGTLLKSVATQYTSSPAPYSQYYYLSAVNVEPSHVITTVGNAVKESDYTYDSGFTYTDGWNDGPSAAGTYGELLEKQEQDFGSGAPGPVLATTDYTYVAQGSTAYLGANLLDLLASVTVYNGAGAQVARTQYGYDETALVPSGITTSLDASPPGPRGNGTSTERWVNTSNSWLASHVAYFDTGMAEQSTDARGNATQNAYSSTYAGAYRTGTTYSETNNVAHVTSAAYDFNTGLLTSSTDENGNTTSYSYDPLLRLAQVTLPATAAGTGWIRFTHNDTPGSVWVERQQAIDGSHSTDEYVLYDGLGRAIVKATANGEATPWDRTDTCFDAEGRVQFSSNPYQGSSPTSAPDCTGAGDTFAYDALGRTVSVTHADGSVVATAYAGAATEVTDGGNGSGSVTRISQVDGLGRLTAVCEVDNSAMPAGGGASPVDCGLDIDGSGLHGFLTTYGYDALGNLTSVTQTGLSSRTFSYNSLSELIAAANPESGTTSYTYDGDGNVLTRTRPAPNQSNPSATVTTTYSYDALNRLTGKSYSDGEPSVQLTYDQGSPWNITATNPIGRLTTADTVAGGATQTGEIFGYDAMGRVVMNNQCTPQDCGNGNEGVAYAYDLLGDMTSATNGAGVTLGYGYNTAGRLTAVTSSDSDANHPPNLISAISYNAAGDEISATLGNGQTETDAFNDRLRLTSEEMTGAATVPPSSGQATVTISGSEQSGSVAATHATGWVSIGGSEQDYNYCYNAGPEGQQCQEMYQGGGVYVTLDGATEHGDYDQGSTDDSVASALATAFNGTGLVTATEGNGTVYFTSVATGSAANYAMSTSNQYSTQYWSSPSFTGYLSGSTLTGGKDASTYYDSGTVSITINGQTVSASYSQSGNNTAALVAQALASAINSNSSYATAAASGSTVSITGKPAGAGSNYSLSVSSATSDPSQFSSPSFTASASGVSLTGGSNGENSGAYGVTGITYAPDGDVLSASDSVNGNWTYQYGPLNRMVQAACSANCPGGQSSVGQEYAYDRFGNLWDRTVTAGSGWPLEISFDANNHIVGASYDAAGDLEGEGSQSFTFDAEGRIVSADGGAVQYLYDAFGHRVEKVTPAGTFYYLHDLAGRPATELNSTGGWQRGEVYAAGRHLATYANGTTFFDYSDWLGTERMRATVAGYENDACTSFPYGAGLSCAGPGADASPTHFTGKVRDATTGLDHFPARYYTSSLGRWITPDPGGVGADVSDPQTWDGYGYGLGNPSTLTDPGGTNVHVCVENDSGTGENCFDLSDAQYAELFKEQNGKGGVNLPGGTFPSGNILCQGQVCGSAQYYEAGLRPESLQLLVLVDGAFSAGKAVLGDLGGLTARFFADQAGEAGAEATAGLGGSALGEIVWDPSVVAAKASSAVGNQSITVSSERVAEQAADRFLGAGKEEIIDRQTGAFKGWKSADGTRIVIDTHSDDAGAHMNFRNLLTGSNLHVRW